MIFFVVFLPLIGFLFCAFFGKKFNDIYSQVITTLLLFVSSIFSWFIFFKYLKKIETEQIYLLNWLTSGNFSVDWAFRIDSLTSTMLIVVTTVSACVHLYSIGYMKEDKSINRFMGYLSLFTFFMLVLVTSNNLLQMFFGWEGVGLASYLLIGFWFKKNTANLAAIKAFIVNRIGDFGFALGIVGIYFIFGSIDFQVIFDNAYLYKEKSFYFLGFNLNIIDTLCFLLFIGAMGKSAQLGLHTWLPDAMEGPTPVSALIHAATMVTAGVFLITRSSPVFEFAPGILNVITIAGSCTAFYAATIGMLQNDLKRVIAYSTCSQLGYMVFACGLSNYSVGMFHLANHAFFKALLFLGAGSVIHAVADEQDMRKMGGLKKLVPFTYSMMTIGSLALIGFPFLTGFYSKDVILEVAYGKYTSYGHFSYLLGSCGAFLTAFYSTRLVYLTFLAKPNGYKSVICAAYDSSYQICFALAVLSIPSMFIGFYTKDMIIGLGTDFWGNAIFVLPENMNMIDAEFIDHIYKVLPVILSLTGATTSFMLYTFGNKLLFQTKVSKVGMRLYNFFNKKWFFDKVYNEYISQFFFRFGYNVSYKTVDRGIFEIFGPMGLSTVITKNALALHRLQSGYIYHYTFVILIGSTLMLGMRQFWTVFGDFVDYRTFIIFLIAGFFMTSEEKK